MISNALAGSERMSTEFGFSIAFQIGSSTTAANVPKRNGRGVARIGLLKAACFSCKSKLIRRSARDFPCDRCPFQTAARATDHSHDQQAGFKGPEHMDSVIISATFGLCLSVVLTCFCRNMFLRLGIVDQPDPVRKLPKVAVP